MRYLIFLSLLASTGFAAQVDSSQTALYVSEGLHVSCGNESVTRDYREPPVVPVGTSDRELVQALRSKLLALSLSSDGNYLDFAVQLQLVSCVKDNSAKDPYWYLEQPDTGDFAEITIPTGVFSGVIKTQKFQAGTLENKAAGSKTMISFAPFHLSLQEILSEGDLQNLKNGKRADLDIKLYYRYTDAESKVRPAFEYYQNPPHGASYGPFGYFQGSFILHLEIDGKTVRSRLGS